MFGYPVYMQEEVIELNRLGDVIGVQPPTSWHRQPSRSPYAVIMITSISGLICFTSLSTSSPFFPGILNPEQHKIEMASLHFLNRFFAIIRGLDRVPFHGKKILQHLPAGLPVFNNQNLQFLHL